MNPERFIYEDKIRELISTDSKNTVHFEYSSSTIRIFTYNPKTGGSFLLAERHFDDTLVPDTDITVLKDIYNDLYADKFGDTTKYQFIVKWYKKGEKKDRPYKSFFTEHSAENVIKKFYCSEESDKLVLYSITNNDVPSKNYDGK